MVKVVAIIQARMASTRLPGKVLKPLAGRPMLAWVVDAAQRSSSIDQVVVATTTEPSDDPLSTWCSKAQVACFRGAALDVLDRFYQAARATRAQIVVRLTADCPFLDPQLIDDLLQHFQTDRAGLDFAANRLPPPWGRSFPVGLDVEVITRAALERAWHEAREPHQREHVTPYFYEDARVADLRFQATGPRWRTTVTPKGFHIALLHASRDWSSWRWTVDTPEDWYVAQRIAQAMGARAYQWRQVLAWLQDHPDIAALNRHVSHKTHRDVDPRFRAP